MPNESAEAYAKLERKVIKMSFNECVQTINTATGRSAISAKRRYDDFYDFFPLQTTLAAMGTLLVCIYLAACIKAMVERRVSRKFYTLILNRVVADLLLSASLLLYGIMDQTATGASSTTFFVLLVFTMSLQATTISYIALSLVKLYAVARPLHFRGSVELGTCVKIIIFSWLGFATFSLSFTVVIVVAANIIYAGDEKMQRQARELVDSLMMSFPPASYVLTLTLYFASVFFIWRAKKLAESFNKARPDKNQELAERVMRERFKIPLMKLSLSVFNLAIFTLPFVAWSTIAAVMDNKLYSKRIVCFTLRSFHTMQILNSITKDSMLLRVIFDVLIGFAIDTEVVITGTATILLFSMDIVVGVDDQCLFYLLQVRSVFNPLIQSILRYSKTSRTSPSAQASGSTKVATAISKV